MKKIYSILFIAFGLFCMSPQRAQAQANVSIQGTTGMLGYMNVFDLANNYQFGSGWALADMKTTESSGCVVLQPNFNVWNPADAYWVIGGVGQKNMEANSYIEDNTLIGQTVNFTGNVTGATINPAYTVVAFIKVLDPALGFATTIYQSTPLSATGPFAVSAAIPNTPGLIVQYGYTVTGVNADPADEATLGNVTVCPPAFLPLELVDFTAQQNRNQVDLSWTSVDESNMHSFEVQKSKNGNDFETFETVPAKNLMQNEYHATDNQLLTENYYRIKIINNDQTFVYSNTRKVILNELEKITLYPNPSSGSITILGSASNKLHMASIYNVSGQQVMQLRGSENEKTIDVSNLPQGIYMLRLQNGESATFTKQ